MFKPTHIFYYAAESKCREIFPNGVPCMKGFEDESGMIEWLADEQGNVAGYSDENASYVVQIKDKTNEHSIQHICTSNEQH